MSKTQKNHKPKASSHLPDQDIVEQLFHALPCDEEGRVPFKYFRKLLLSQGFLKDDPRLKETWQTIFQLDEQKTFDLEIFRKIVGHNITLSQKILTSDLVIPDFSGFRRDIESIFEKVRKNHGGEVASYIPQLKRVNPEFYAMSICTVDGQRFSLGDFKEPYCVQSTYKPINYCLALESMGCDTVHNHVGREPSGLGFNELTLNKAGHPHNPMINAGAIMCCSMIKPEWSLSDRFDYLLGRWQALSGDQWIGFNNAVYLSEKQTADRNFALGYFMREKGAFPKGTRLEETLDFYFQCCSMELTVEAHAVVAGTLANAGVCPLTGEFVLAPDNVKHCLSLMHTCGMYDFSGEFAFSVGLPAKSRVSGALILIVPNVMGIVIWSPRLDVLGNSVRGIEFCQELVEQFNFHNYDSMLQSNTKKDPRQQKFEKHLDHTMSLCWAASHGDIFEVQRLYTLGVNVNAPNYDGRTPLHLAASEGYEEVVRYFIDKGVDLSPKDRWGGTPLSDAQRGNYKEVIQLLKKHGATN